MKKSSCGLCERPSLEGNPYCTYHDRAHSEVKKKFRDWSYAFENMSWERYLETIIGLKETGDLAKAVAVQELRKANPQKSSLKTKLAVE
jgi:hypothetical protein